MATVFTHQGKAVVTARLKGLGTEPFWLAWGTGAGTAAAGDTALFSEANEARVAGTSSQQTTSQTSDTYQVLGTLTANATKTITNAGLFDQSSGGSCFVKGDFSGHPLNAGDAIQFTVKAIFS